MVYVAYVVPLYALVFGTRSSTGEQRQGIVWEHDNFAVAIEVDGAVLIILNRVRNWHQQGRLGVNGAVQMEDLF